MPLCSQSATVAAATYAATPAALHAAAPKAKKAAKPVEDPPYATMIAAAIKGLGDKKGSSRQAILKHVVANNKVDAAKAAVRVRLALANMKAAKKPAAKKAAKRPAKKTDQGLKIDNSSERNATAKLGEEAATSPEVELKTNNKICLGVKIIKDETNNYRVVDK